MKSSDFYFNSGIVSSKQWISCQLGAREHYAIARALHLRGELNTLFTDMWVGPGTLLGYLNRSLENRYHPQLGDALVKSNMLGLFVFEVMARIKRVKGWARILARNEWFQKSAVAALRNRFSARAGIAANPRVVFAYSYAAREIFIWAKAHGWKTVLGQIDAGPEMGRTIERLDQKHAQYRMRSTPPSNRYWDAWRDECTLADRIIVNSDWVRKALMLEAVAVNKIKIVPLAFEAPGEASTFQRLYPVAFTSKRPMRVLFLGQVSLLKGIVSLLEAADLLRGEPVEFHIVGQISVNIPECFRNRSGIIWVGTVPRSAVAAYYRRSDVFLFPTHGDGFGLTQLEAQAWQLPVIASRCCGDVVVDAVNGVRLSEVTGKSIASALRALRRNPDALRRMARNSAANPRFSLGNVGRLLEDAAVLSKSSADKDTACNLM